MTKLTFGIEMEMFIELNKRVYQLIKEQISNHKQVNNIKQLINYIYINSLNEKNPFIKDYNEDTSKFVYNLLNGYYTNTILSQEDAYIIILIITYIICNNNDSKYSLSLFIFSWITDAAAVGVGARISATKSVRVKSVS